MRHALLLFLPLAACASGHGPAPGLAPPAVTVGRAGDCAAAVLDPARDLSALLHTLSTEYAYSAEHQLEWDALGAALTARLASVHDRPSLATLLETAIDALHDPHANLGTNTDHSFRLVPSGADVWAELDGEQHARVVEVRRGSAAAAAGLRPGEEVVAVAGVPLSRAIDARLDGLGGRDPLAREWALRSLLAGRHDEHRRWTVASASGALREVAPVDSTEGDGDRGPPLAWRRLSPRVGYVVVHDRLGDDALVPAFDAALAELHDCGRLVIDLRDTPSGGNTSVAEAIMGRLVKEPRLYQRYELPGDGYQGRSRVWDQYVTPRGPFTYEGAVAVLVDHWTGSMGEGMAMGLDAMRRATVVGTPMAGLNGAVHTETLPSSGIRFSFPAERLFHLDGTPRHRWRPPVLVAPGDPTAGGDPILERALAIQAEDGPTRATR